MNVSIILVNFNTKKLTCECINSIKSHVSKHLEYEIIVVDNASSDGSQEEFSKIEGIKLVLSPENLGFGRGNNLGASHASGEYLFLLNSDTILLEDSVTKLHDFFKRNENSFKIGTLGCLLVDQNQGENASAFRFSNVKSVISDTLKGLLSKFFKFKAPEEYDFKQSYLKVDYVIGADLMIKNSVFKEMKGFDDDYFMYFEEADLQKRILKKGLNAYIITDTKIIHLEGGSTDSKKLTNRRRTMIQVSRNLYLKKNDSKKYFFYVLFDFSFSFFRLFNRNYTFSENFKFLKENFKSY